MNNSTNNQQSRLIGWSGKAKTVAVVSALAAIAAFNVCTAAGKKPAPKPVRADIDKSALIAGPVYDKDGNLANGEPPLPGDTLLWGNNYGLCPEFRPITSQGRQLTLAEYSGAEGTASMKRVEKGTHVVVHLSGLVPNGVYSILVLTFGPPGFTPDFSTWIGEGALGGPGRNGFVASPTGHAQLSVIHPPGDLSTFGSTTGLLDEAETQLLVSLHLDDQIQDPMLGEHCPLEIPAAFRFVHD
jgi:hypothetical protein